MSLRLGRKADLLENWLSPNRREQRILKTQTIPYESSTQMEHGVERLSDEGWILKRLLRGSGETSVAEFYQRDSKSFGEPFEEEYPSS